MKITDLRKMIGSAKRPLVEKAFAECYKSMTKAQKEKIDGVILAILRGEDVKTATASAKKEELNFDALDKEITDFMDNAYDGNYYYSNREVAKKDRPKWRFLVMRYIKTLSSIPHENENYDRAVDLLDSLYQLLCYACGYYTFHTTEDPFRSIGWEQSNLFDLLVKMVFQEGYTAENISWMLDRATDAGLSRESLHRDMLVALLGELKTSDLKYMAIEEAKSLAKETRATIPMDSDSLFSMDYYDDERKVEALCDFILLTAISLSEPDPAIEFYFEYSTRRDHEVTLYCVLDNISFMEENDLWIRVYEGAVAKQIEPRKNLQDAYARRLKERDKPQQQDAEEDS